MRIGEIRIGDTVYAYDEFTGEVEEHTVVNTFVHDDDQIVYLTIDGEEIETTPWVRVDTALPSVLLFNLLASLTDDDLLNSFIKHPHPRGL